MSDIARCINLGRGIEHGCLWVICALSFGLWFVLDGDFQNALSWAWKTPGPFGAPLASVRLDKVVICLSWSMIVIGGITCYELAKAKILLFLGIALLVLFIVSIVQISDFVMVNAARPIGPLSPLATLGILVLLLVGGKIAVAAIVAYRLLARDAFPQKHAAIGVAVTFGACGLMIWTGLFDVLYPGISWRPPVIRP